VRFLALLAMALIGSMLILFIPVWVLARRGGVAKRNSSRTMKTIDLGRITLRIGLAILQPVYTLVAK
jgi:hypothetical protein